MVALPPFQRKVPLPEAVSVTDPQPVAVPLMEAVGSAFTVTVAVSVSVHPEVEVTVTV